MINWKVRIKSKTFWLALVPAIILLVQTVAAGFGYSLDFQALEGHLIEVVNAVFLLLTILGIVVDPTTAGVSDSALAMTYEKPRLRNENADAALIQAFAEVNEANAEVE